VFEPANDLAEDFVFEEKKVSINNTINKKIEKYIKTKINLWKPDNVSVVIMATDGKVISSVGFKKKVGFNRFSPFTSVHPAASLFKIVTAASLFENGSKANDVISYKGKGTTLYKYQLRKISSYKWVRKVTFSDAFAKSNNVVMGKLALQKLNEKKIATMALKFRFNRPIIKNYTLLKSSFKNPENKYNLAEISSGFNDTTLMSPIHASVMTNIVLNDGKYCSPYFISSYVIDKNNYNEKCTPEFVIKKSSAKKIQSIMEKTLYKGTARKHFKRLWKKYESTYTMGGKTGTLKGGIPYGTNDWFTFFIKNKLSGKGLVISTLIVNEKKWYVKSAHLTKLIANYLIRKKYI